MLLRATWTPPLPSSAPGAPPPWHDLHPTEGIRFNLNTSAGPETQTFLVKGATGVLYDAADENPQFNGNIYGFEFRAEPGVTLGYTLTLKDDSGNAVTSDPVSLDGPVTDTIPPALPAGMTVAVVGE